MSLEKYLVSYRFRYFKVIGQYPTPPPVATGPGLDRPIFVPGADYGMETYTMNRTRMFYQDQV